MREWNPLLLIQAPYLAPQSQKDASGHFWLYLLRILPTAGDQSHLFVSLSPQDFHPKLSIGR